MTEKEIVNTAIDLLFVIWRGASADFKSKYKREIWGIFENFALVSAKQNGTLAGFATQLTRKMGGELGRNQADRDIAIQILGLGYDEDILNCIRTRISYLILFVRERVSKAREEFDNEYSN